MKYGLLLLMVTIFSGNLVAAEKWVKNPNKQEAINNLHWRLVTLDDDPVNKEQVIGMIKFGVPLNEKRNGLTLLQTLFRSQANAQTKSEIANVMLDQEKPTKALVDEATFLDAFKAFDSNEIINRIRHERRMFVTKPILSYLYVTNDPRFEMENDFAPVGLSLKDKLNLKVRTMVRE